jgi:predicted HTH transcriptional regulator
MTKFGQENSTTEFKRQLSDALEKEVVAFLNSAKGGDLYIGVDDDGEVLGVSDVDAQMLAISDRIRNNILPSCLGLYDVYAQEHEGKTIIHVVVTRGTEKPYYLKRYGQSPAGCFTRVGSGVQPMTTGMIDQLYAGRVRHSLRNIPAPTTLKLTFQQLKIYYQEKGFEINDTFLHNLDLYVPDSEHLNYAAYLLADTNSISIKVAKYAGTDKCDLIENQEYGYCSLLKATHRVLDKLEIENRTLTRITGAAEREQRRLFNARALREALINAIIHNDYTAEVPPLVEIYADRLSITSYGGLLSGLSLEECLSGRSMPRNRELMRVFRDMELVEHLGSGMRRILSAYDSHIVHISEHFFELRFPMASEALALIPEGAESGAESGAELGAESLSKKILHLLRDAALSKSELSSQLGLKSVTGALNRAVNALLEAHWIERTLPDKPQSRLQKYRLTQAGRGGMDTSGKQDTVGRGEKC